MLVRDATEADLPEILAIHNDAVLTGTAIWSYHAVDLANRRDWLQARQAQGYAVLVAVDPAAAEGAQVLGHASFGDWRPHDGYRLTVEHSVYVHQAARGRGVGLALMTALIERARAIGKHVMVAGVDAGNAPSIKLHEKLGFRVMGVMPEVGAKFGRWLDLAFLQLTLDERAAPPD